MKKLTYLALAFSVAFFTSCDDEDGFYNEKYIDVPNLITVDVQPAYSVGDYLYVQADFSRYLNEPGQETPLDIYQTTSGANGFVFSYTLEKESAPGTWQPVETSVEALDITNGTAQAGSFVLATAVYDTTDETYEYNAGFPLLSAGNYRLSFGVNSDSNTEIELRSKSQANKLFLNIISDTDQLTGGGYYEFTVN